MGKIAVIGDVMLDMYDFCRNRDNPESSAPCYIVERTEYRPGGAGNVAANLWSLGSKFDLVSVVGNDSNAQLLEKVLEDFKISHRLVRDPNRPTIVKERTMSISDGRYHYRKDRELKLYIEENHVSEVLEGIKDYDVIIVSDYAKGMISKNLMDRLKETNIPIIVDPKPIHKEFYRGVFLIKPNSKEVIEMTGEKNDLKAAEILRDSLETNVLLTRGREGISYFGVKGENYSFPTEAKKVFDVTGAGDTVVATLAHFLLKGIPMREAIKLANKAAGIAVAYPGCYQISEREILEH